MTFGEVLSLYMDELGVTQAELARRIGVGRQTVNNIMTGAVSNPRLDTAAAIADALGVSLQEMVDRMKENEL